MEMSYGLLLGLSGCRLVLLAFLFCGCVLGPGHILRSFHGTFHRGRGDIFILVGVCVHQKPCEVPVMLSAKLF